MKDEFFEIKKIGIISDTHIPIRAKNIPEKVFKIFESVDLILHAGDLVELYVIEELEKIAPVVAVKGNMDRFIDSLPEKRIIKVNNKFKIGIIHGSGDPFSLPVRVKKEFRDVDCIVFGHSHRAFNELVDGILLFNPGSACDTVFTSVNSVGLLYIGDKIKGEIIRIN